MEIKKTNFFQGNKIEISEMVLKSDDNKFDLSWKVYFEAEMFQITFLSISSFRIREVSMPLEIHGFEIIDHSKDGWSKDSRYEIRDFEDDRVGFFCGDFKINKCL